MLKTVFTLIIAGCGDGSAECTVLDRMQISEVSMAACEARLDERLLRMAPGYPEYSGLCIPANRHIALPDTWTQPLVQYAGAE